MVDDRDGVDVRVGVERGGDRRGIDRLEIGRFDDDHRDAEARAIVSIRSP